MNPTNPVTASLPGPAPHQKADRETAQKAFIVEDNAMIRENLVETLTELAGIQTVGYSATEEGACSWLEQHPSDWQLLVVDLFLLQGNGLGVLKKCSRRSRQQRVVVLSNYATTEMRSRCLMAGADAVFDKSTELDLFLDYCSAKH